jgi:transposase
MKRIQIKDHLSLAEIEKRYRQASEGVERSQWQIIWLLGQGKTSREIEAVTGYSLRWIRIIAQRYNADGAVGIGDQRHANPGRGAALNSQQQAALTTALAQAHERGENWNGKRVAVWMSEQLGRTIHMQRGYEWLAKLNRTPQVPRPQHTEANMAEPDAFKKRFL